MKRTRKKTDNILLVIASICIGAFGHKYYVENYQKETNEPIIENNEGLLNEKISISGATIQWQINALGQLDTAAYYFDRTQTVEKIRELDLNKIGIKLKFDIPGTSSGFSYSYQGVIKAGIDFDKVVVEKDDDNKTVAIILPKTKIMNSQINPESYQFYIKNNNILNPIDPEDYALSLADLIKQEEDKAIENGILEQAQENATKIIEDLLKSLLSEEEYQIIISVN